MTTFPPTMPRSMEQRFELSLTLSVHLRDKGRISLPLLGLYQAPSAEENQYITASDDDSAHLAEWQQKFDWERKIHAANKNLFGNRTFRYVLLIGPTHRWMLVTYKLRVNTFLLLGPTKERSSTPRWPDATVSSSCPPEAVNRCATRYDGHCGVSSSRLFPMTMTSTHSSHSFLQCAKTE